MSAIWTVALRVVEMVYSQRVKIKSIINDKNNYSIRSTDENSVIQGVFTMSAIWTEALRVLVKVCGPFGMSPGFNSATLKYFFISAVVNYDF
jgi:hypothetical protein